MGSPASSRVVRRLPFAVWPPVSRFILLAVVAFLVAGPVSGMSGPVDAQVPQSGPPATPTGLTGTFTHESVSLSWDHPGDPSITSYQILRRQPGIHEPGEFIVHVDDTNSLATSYVDTAVEAEARYVYRVKARNSFGLSERSSFFNAVLPAPPTPGLPARPTGLTGTFTHESVSLSWDDPADPSITSYQILRRQPGIHEPGESRALLHRPCRRHQQLGHVVRGHLGRGRNQLRLPSHGPQQCRSERAQQLLRRRPPSRSRSNARTTGSAKGPHGRGGWRDAGRPVVDRAGRRRRLLDPRLPDRSIRRRRDELGRPTGGCQYGKHRHGARPHRPCARSEVALPGLGHQLGWHGGSLERRQRDHRRPHSPAPGLGSGGRLRRHAGTALQRAARPRRGQAHGARPHRPCARSEVALPGLGHQLDRRQAPSPWRPMASQSRWAASR